MKMWRVILYILFLSLFLFTSCKLIAEGILQARDTEKALDAFTRAVQLDPENGEAWNNIACLYAFFTLLSYIPLLSCPLWFCLLFLA